MTNETTDLATNQDDPQRPACGRGLVLGAGRGPGRRRHPVPEVPERDVDGAAERGAPVALQVPAAAGRGAADQVLRLGGDRGAAGAPFRLRGPRRGGQRIPGEHRGQGASVL